VSRETQRASRQDESRQGHEVPLYQRWETVGGVSFSSQFAEFAELSIYRWYLVLNMFTLIDASLLCWHSARVQPSICSYLYNFISVQLHRSTRSSDVV